MSLDIGAQTTMKIIDNFISNEEATTIKNYILKNEVRVKNLGPDIYPGTSDDSLTGRYKVYNWLTNKTVGLILEPKLSKLFSNMYIQLWANIFRKGEGITEHRHGYSHTTSGNLFIYGPDSSATGYKRWGLQKNKVGTLVTFSSDVVHWVEPSTSDTPRISMAFDVQPTAEFFDSTYSFVKLPFIPCGDI